MKRLIGTVIVLILTLCFSWVFGHIRFSDAATYILAKFSSRLGILGCENVEDFYMIFTVMIAFILSLVVAKALTKFIKF
jgi:hypothetical protein